MTAKDGDRDQVGDCGDFACGVFNGAKCLQASLLVLCVLLVPLRHARIQIPAVIVEARLAGKSFDLRARLLFDVNKSDDDIGNLHTGVVDVVLNVDFPARVMQQADKSIAKDGIAHVSDMRGLVGIDA